MIFYYNLKNVKISKEFDEIPTMSGVKNIIINGNLAAVDVSDDFLKDFFLM